MGRPVLQIGYHDHCFDGVASAATFVRFYREKVRPGLGLDSIALGGLAHRAGQLFGDEVFAGTINGQGGGRAWTVPSPPDNGNDRLVLDDGGDGNANSYTITSNSVSRAGAAVITYSLPGPGDVFAGELTLLAGMPRHSQRPADCVDAMPSAETSWRSFKPSSLPLSAAAPNTPQVDVMCQPLS